MRKMDSLEPDQGGHVIKSAVEGVHLEQRSSWDYKFIKVWDGK